MTLHSPLSNFNRRTSDVAQIPVAVPRPQVSIERLPARRPTNEPRESMNCRSCRKRKIKCNRLTPSCEACEIFQCPCVYDAVPKKRGPKTDVLEALLRRVDGLEAKLKDTTSAEQTPATSPRSIKSLSMREQGETTDEHRRKRLAMDDGSDVASPDPSPFGSFAFPHYPSHSLDAQTNAYLQVYFDRFHGKPFYILDEAAIRQRLRLGQLPIFLNQAINAFAARHTPHAVGHEAARSLSETFFVKSRASLDLDEPSADTLQALLLLVLASMAAGQGKRAYSLFASAVGMASALELHREVDSTGVTTPAEQEARRRLFWSCYILDRFLAVGSRRPTLLDDDIIMLRLPSSIPATSSVVIEGSFFPSRNDTHLGDVFGHDDFGRLVNITRILGVAHRHVATGDAKSEAQKTQSMSIHDQIRRELQSWSVGIDILVPISQDVTSQRRPDAVCALLGKLVFHTIHCMLDRPLLAIDLNELTTPSPQQQWQMEATTTCFAHANAITEIVDFAKQQSSSGALDWPVLVGFCIATAGTVHIHGAHYDPSMAAGNLAAAGNAVEYLARDIQHLGELSNAWACVWHQHQALEKLRRAHRELLKLSTVFVTSVAPYGHFFRRYQHVIDQPGSLEIPVLALDDVPAQATKPSPNTMHIPGSTGPSRTTTERRQLKRKNTAPPIPVHSHLNLNTFHEPRAPHRHSFSHFGGPPMVGVVQQQQQHHHHHHHQSPGSMSTPTSLPPPPHAEFSGTFSLQHASLFAASFPAFDSPTAWQGADQVGTEGGMPRVQSPQSSAKSMCEGDRGAGAEIDPFMSLMQSLAESGGDGSWAAL